MRSHAAGAMVVAAMVATAPRLALAQASAAAALPAQCGSVARPIPPADAQRRAARELAAQAQEAAITADVARARDLYQRAATLDPSDASVAYALGRSYESAKDARASAEYCRFLALSPSAPESDDVRQRLARIVGVAAASNPLSARAGIAPPTGASPGAALATGIFVPGGGQYATGRPAAGLLVTAAVGGALYYALQTQTVRDSVLTAATDPNGKPYQFWQPTARSERSHLAAGAAAAGGLSLIAAIEAYAHARSARSDARMRASNETSPAVAPIVTDLRWGVGMGVRIALGGH